MLPAELDGTAIASGEQIVFAKAAAVPDRSNCVDHMLGFEPVAPGDFGIAGRTTIQRATLGQQFRSGRPMDRTIDAAPAEQGRIRGVDDGVNAQCRDVGNDDFQPRLADLARCRTQAEAAVLTATPLSANSCCNSPAWNISRMMSQPPMNSPLT